MWNVPVVELHDFCMHHGIDEVMIVAPISAGQIDAWIANNKVWIGRSDAMMIKMEVETFQAEEAEKDTKHKRRK